MALKPFYLADYSDDDRIIPHIEPRDPSPYDQKMQVFDTEAVRSFQRSYDRFLERQRRIEAKWEKLYRSGEWVDNPNYDPETAKPPMTGMEYMLRTYYTPTLQRQLENELMLLNKVGSGEADPVKIHVYNPPLDYVATNYPPLTRWQRLKAFLAGR